MTLRPMLRLGSVTCVVLATAGCGGGSRSGEGPGHDGGGSDGTVGPDGSTSHDAGHDATRDSKGGGPGEGGGGSHDSGASADAATNSDAGSAAKGTLINTFVGVNGFNWNAVSDLAVAGSLREYTDWSWTEGTFPYPHNEDDWYDWNHDAFYASLTDAGIDPMPCIEGPVPFVNDGGIPPASGDPTQPASYAAHADHLFQYAARYGGTVVGKSLLKDDAGNPWAFPEPTLTGQKEIRYFENGNEVDATWILPGGAPLESATAMAANCSADYDGDQGRMGPTFGIKQADPTAKMVLAGMSQGGNPTAALAYLQGILDWSNTHRGGSVPFDVINLHNYNVGTTSGVSPESTNLVATMKKFTAWRDANMAGKEVWVTEFGFDTNSASPLGVPTIGPNSNFIVQGQWILRSMLAMLEAGIDRAYIYWLADQACGAYCADMFNTCGLIDVNNQRKAAYYMVNAFRSRLATMRYAAEVTSGNANVDIVSFADTHGPGGAYVLWAPTSNATVVNGYSLPVPAAATTATQVLLVDQQLTGTASPLTIMGGAVTVDVSETPTLVILDHL